MQKESSDEKIASVKSRLKLKGSDNALGKRAVGIGIAQGAVPLTGTEIKRIVPMHGKYEGKSLIRKENGAVWVTDTANVRRSASGSDIARRHSRMRNSRGRVKYARDRSFREMALVNKMHVPQAAYRKYLAKKQKRVGKLKGGWVAGLKYFGGTKSPPKWINQHSMWGSAGGTMSKSGNGRLWAVNKVPYASHHKWTSDYNFRRRPQLAVTAMEKRIEAEVRAENRRARKNIRFVKSIARGIA